MALPRWLARFNVAVTNRLMLPIARVLPWFGIVEHIGRRSGRHYQTPVNVSAAVTGIHSRSPMVRNRNGCATWWRPAAARSSPVDGASG